MSTLHDPSTLHRHDRLVWTEAYPCAWLTTPFGCGITRVIFSPAMGKCPAVPGHRDGVDREYNDMLILA